MRGREEDTDCPTIQNRRYVPKAKASTEAAADGAAAGAMEIDGQEGQDGAAAAARARARAAIEAERSRIAAAAEKKRAAAAAPAQVRAFSPLLVSVACEQAKKLPLAWRMSPSS